MINYSIQIIFFQALFFLVYELMLKKETFFTGNRMYLLATQILVLVIPFLKFDALQQSIPVDYQNTYTKSYYNIKDTLSFQNTIVDNIGAPEIRFQWHWLIYIGMGVAFVLFIIKLYQIVKVIQQGQLIRHNNRKIISIPHPFAAFSFLNYIIMGNHIPMSKQDEIIAHEEIHIKQKHSLDLLFFEVLRIICWFNPFVYLYQRRITEVHEFIVDQQLNLTNKHKEHYFNALLSEVFQTQKISFTNSFYKASLIKKRIQMLTKMKSKNRQRLKYFFIAPVLVIAISVAACNHNSKQLAVLMETTSWQSTNYKTGDAIGAFQYHPQIEKNGSRLTIKNDHKTKDAIVKIIENDSDAIYRDVFIKNGEDTDIKNLPVGRYYLKIAWGNQWKETCIEKICFGKFMKNEAFQKRYFEHLLEIKIRKSVVGKRINHLRIAIK